MESSPIKIETKDRKGEDSKEKKDVYRYMGGHKKRPDI